MLPPQVRSLTAGPGETSECHRVLFTGNKNNTPPIQKSQQWQERGKWVWSTIGQMPTQLFSAKGREGGVYEEGVQGGRGRGPLTILEPSVAGKKPLVLGASSLVVIFSCRGIWTEQGCSGPSRRPFPLQPSCGPTYLMLQGTQGWPYLWPSLQELLRLLKLQVQAKAQAASQGGAGQ